MNMNDLIKCILIDDDEDDYEIFKMALGEIDKNIELQYAFNGTEAIRKLNEDHSMVPDLIFIDLNMPRMNGSQCLEFIRKTAHLKNIPVYIYSTSSDPITIAETKKKGATDFIVKPSNLISLVQILSGVLKIQTHKR